MNERITIVSDKEVRIQRNKIAGLTNVIKIVEDGEWTDIPDYPGICDGHYICTWDALGRAALRDCINCLEATGSFAALSDTSAVPFVGKRMRIARNDTSREVVILGSHGDRWIYQNDENLGRHSCVAADRLLPLAEPPKPKVRAWTPVEAAAHLGRKLNLGYSNYLAKHVDSEGMRFEVRCGREYTWMNFEALTKYTWADDGSPCGVIEA